MMVLKRHVSSFRMASFEKLLSYKGEWLAKLHTKIGSSLLDVDHGLM